MISGVIVVCSLGMPTDGRASSEKHSSDEDVGQEAENDVDAVSRGTISSTNGFEAVHSNVSGMFTFQSKNIGSV
jgi:hypothetical protein